MSYVTKVLHIDKDTLQEFEKASITQDSLITLMFRSWSRNPQYLLLIKPNEFIIVDKQGNIVLRKTVGYTIESGAINDDGKVALKSGANLYIYDKNGNELYHTTFSAGINAWLQIRQRYLWLIIATSPPTVYIYDLNDFTYTSFTVDAYSAEFVRLFPNEYGDMALGARWVSSPACYLLKADLNGIVDESSSISSNAVQRVTCTPNLASCMISFSRTVGSTNYYEVGWFLNNLNFKSLYSGSNTGHSYFVHDLNITKALIFRNNSLTVEKWELDPETFTATKVDTFNLSENPETVSVDFGNGDMTPDGKYAVITTSKILIIDYDTKEVVKEIPKAFTKVPVRILVA